MGSHQEYPYDDLHRSISKLFLDDDECGKHRTKNMPVVFPVVFPGDDQKKTKKQ